MKLESKKCSQEQIHIASTKQHLICLLDSLQRSISSEQSIEVLDGLLHTIQPLVTSVVTQSSGTESGRNFTTNIPGLTNVIFTGANSSQAVKAWWDHSVENGLYQWLGTTEEN